MLGASVAVDAYNTNTSPRRLSFNHLDFHALAAPATRIRSPEKCRNAMKPEEGDQGDRPCDHPLEIQGPGYIEHDKH